MEGERDGKKNVVHGGRKQWVNSIGKEEKSEEIERKRETQEYKYILSKT